MPPRRRLRDSTAPLWLAATAATTIIAGGVWAWYALRDATPATEQESASAPTERVKRRNGPKPPLSLATPVLPPTWLISRISDDYELHLIFPTKSSFPSPPQYRATSFDPHRILFHETAEGLTHLARVVGGILVKVERGVEGEELPIEDGEEMVEVDTAKLKEGTGNFVREFIVVGGGGASGDKAGTVVKGWEELAQLLGV
ncbi:hypothetical protein MNV49_004941 [Pseudohyphozyma bogoriensis]|nr:hypothetical protein MNV49_004941 [Pseudohyphozyma bogoriensis]